MNNSQLIFKSIGILFWTDLAGGEAGRKMVGIYFFEFGFAAAAGLLGVKAARMKSAA